MPSDRKGLSEVLRRNRVDASGLEELFATTAGSVFGLRCGGGEEALEVWEVLYDLIGQTGCWPVMLGTQRDLDHHKSAAMGGGPAVSAMIDLATSLSAGQWLGDRGGARGEEQWPDAICPSNAFHVPFDVESARPLAELIIALVPTVRPWEVAAWLRFGGFGRCPPPQTHVAIWRRWYDRWRAVVVAVTADAVEMLVERPPRTRGEALELAAEQDTYCGGIAGSRAELAACLLGGTAWYFWWE